LLQCSDQAGLVKNPSDLFEAALKAGDAFAEGAGTRSTPPP